MAQHHGTRCHLSLGQNFTYDPNIPGYVGSPVPAPIPFTPETSGEDWWFAHCNLYDANGNHIGYAAAGYNRPPNWGFVDSTGCFSSVPTGVDHGEFATVDRRKGASRTWIARFDLEGHMVWCKSYLPGVLMGITQATDLSIVAIGEAHANRRGEGPNNLVGQWPVHYNPGITTSGDITTLACDSVITCNGQPTTLGPKAGRTPTIMKTDLDGVVQWQHFYGIPTELCNGWSAGGGFGWTIKPSQVNGQPGFLAVCSGGTGDPSEPGEHPFVLWLDNNGHIEDRHVFWSNDPAMVAIGASGIGVRPIGMDLRTIGGQERLAISGNIHAANQRSFLWYFDTTNPNAFTPALAQVTNSTSLTAHHDANKVQNCTGVVLAEENGQPVVAWPVLADYSIGFAYSGRNAATLKVHRFNPPTIAPVWTANLGDVRAYALQAAGVFTSDGLHLAFVSSRWSYPYSSSNPFGYNDLPPDVQTCINTDFPDANWPSANLFDYWKTDAYVAKLRLSSGQIVWTTTFDSDPNAEHGCWPSDIRKQECMYKITEAADGGFVISGNTSHNFDDAYLAKLMNDCQSMLSYENLPLDGEGVHTLVADQTWTTDKNILGQLVVPAGKTLTITSGATIRFADSEQMQWPTQLIVKPGGKLFMDNGATLSAVQGCPNSMWDGGQIRGNYFASQQTTSNQGYAVLRSGATVEHARTGLLAAWGDPKDPLGGIIKESTGGIIQATDAIFRNNRYDAVFHKYENRTSGGSPIANRSFFTRTSFSTQGDLNNPDLYPRDHVAMVGTRGIPFRGCDFGNSIVGTTYQLPFEQGVGIRAINSTFTVRNDCNIILPYPNPCPPQNTTTSTFTNLHYGVITTTSDPSRSFSVSDATFTGTNHGIRMEGVQDAVIHRNTFNVPQPITPGLVTSPYGVYSDQCTGYSIQENIFRTSQPSGLRKVGLVIKDSGPWYNTFYNNRFDNLYAAGLIEGKNATANGSTGLEVKCNDFGQEQRNDFDVRIAGQHVYIQNKQGAAVSDPNDPLQMRNPAGNRFSDAHAGSVAEADWFVQNTSTFVEYFHHQPTTGNRTRPDYHDPNWLLPTSQVIQWPTQRTLACPSRLDGGGHEVKREMAEQGHEEYVDSKTAYDATKDEGDTYTLLGYVGNAAHSSAQVRNALQSVAPKVGVEVWQTAFERDPAMNAWHITQALIANSPLQGEVLKMVDHYGLPSAYADLVLAAQSGDVNILSLLESDMARHAGAKAEAFADLGRMAWLDSLHLDASLDSLLLVHDALPADNRALARSGVLAAKGEYTALEALADAETVASEIPELYGLLKHLAVAQQNGGWDDTSVVDVAWLQQLGAQRDVIGSAQANAWLHALGYDLPTEIIILDDEGPKSLGARNNRPDIAWETGVHLEVFPNPSTGPVFAVYEVPEGVFQAELRLLDVHGRILHSQRLGEGPGLAQLSTTGFATGMYLAELRMEGHRVAQAKLAVQR